jgi:hypothetical protein
MELTKVVGAVTRSVVPDRRMGDLGLQVEKPVQFKVLGWETAANATACADALSSSASVSARHEVG